jgi:predicted Fe-Mo cluster-binding NifX family protein
MVHNNLERLNTIIQLKPDIVICDGISSLSHQKLVENKIKVIPWVHGTIEEVINNFLSNNIYTK